MAVDWRYINTLIQYNTMCVQVNQDTQYSAEEFTKKYAAAKLR